MSIKDRRIFVVTGGLGFIGKHFVQRCLDLGHFVINIDMVSYAADRKVMESFLEYEEYRFIQENVETIKHLPECDVLVNFAAESHVDNSIADNRQFCSSNIMGTQQLLELTRARVPIDRPHFIQISTDEVYGDIAEGLHSETHPLRPSNPYSAAKAAADMLVFGWSRTYDLKYNIIRPSNNYGLHQYPEKLIPKTAWRLMRGLPALMHGDGSYVRTWLHVEDTVDAIFKVIEQGQENEIYNICGTVELQNIEVIRMIASYFGLSDDEAVVAVGNRAGQDIRYGLDDTKLRALGWAPTRKIEEELPKIAKAVDLKRFL